MAYPYYSSWGGGAASGGAGVQITIPATDAGDIVIIVAMDADNDPISVSGWTEGGQFNTNSNMAGAWFWYRSPGRSSFLINVTSLSTAGQGIFAYSFIFKGCIESGTPFEDQDSSAVVQGTTADVHEVTTSGPERLVTSIIIVEDNVTIDTATDYAENLLQITDFGGGVAVKIQSQQVASASTTTARTPSIGGNDYHCSFTFAWIPVESSSSSSSLSSSSKSSSSSSRSSSSKSSSSSSSISVSSSSSSLSLSSSSSSKSSSSSCKSSSSSSSSVSYTVETFGENTTDDYSADVEDCHMDGQNPTFQEDTNDLLTGEDAGGEYSSWIKFHITNQIFNATVLKAEFHFYVSATAGTMGSNALTFFRCVTGDPIENQLTWNIRKTGTNWAAGGGKGGVSGATDDSSNDIDTDWENYGSVPSTGWKYIDLTDLIKSWVDGTRKEYGFVMIQNDPTDDYLLTITDTEGADGNRPYLKIWYDGGYSSSSSSISSSSSSRSSSSSSTSSVSSSSSSRSSSSRSSSSSSLSSSSSSKSSSSLSFSSSSRSSSSSCISSSSSSWSSTSISFSSSSRSSSSSVSYRKKRFTGYICCEKFGEIQYEDHETDLVDVDYANKRITTWLKKDDGRPMRNRIKAQFTVDYLSLGIRPCWKPELDGEIFIRRPSVMGYVPEFGYDTPVLRAIDLEDFPRVYYDNPTHCQWHETEIRHVTKTWTLAASELWMEQAPTGGQEVKATKAEVIPGQGRQNQQILQNQIVPGGAVTLGWQFNDGDTIWDNWDFTHTYFNTKYLTGGKITWRNTNRYGSGDNLVFIPSYRVLCNGHYVDAYGSDFIDWEVGDWAFAIVRPMDNDPARWDEDDRLTSDDIEDISDLARNEHLMIIPLKIGQHGN